MMGTMESSEDRSTWMASATLRETIEKTITLAPGSMYHAGFTYSPGGYVRITVEEIDRVGFTEVAEPPIDVLFMTPSQYEAYEADFDQNDGDANNSYHPSFELAYLSITSIEFALGSLGGLKESADLGLGPVEMVIENANFTYNGARAYERVTVKIVLWVKKVPRDFVMENDLRDQSSVGNLLSSAISLVVSSGILIPFTSGIIGMIVGYKGLPVIFSRINRLRGSNLQLQRHETETDVSKPDYSKDSS